MIIVSSLIHFFYLYWYKIKPRRITLPLLLGKLSPHLDPTLTSQTICPQTQLALPRYSDPFFWLSPLFTSGRHSPLLLSAPSTQPMNLCIDIQLLFIQSKTASEVTAFHRKHKFCHKIGCSAGQFSLEIPSLDSSIFSVPTSSDDISSSLDLLPESKDAYWIMTGIYLGWCERSASIMMTNCPLHNLIPSLYAEPSPSLPALSRTCWINIFLQFSDLCRQTQDP